FLHGRQAVVKPAGFRFVKHKRRALAVYPAFSRQGAGLQFLHQHRGGIRPVLQMDPVLFAAL
ncbi:hypothetical protein KMBAHK_KMBAHK_11380, partial [Dysosmobacter welbionis]